jgi:hypothetical protein
VPPAIAMKARLPSVNAGATSSELGSLRSPRGVNPSFLSRPRSPCSASGSWASRHADARPGANCAAHLSASGPDGKPFGPFAFWIVRTGEVSMCELVYPGKFRCSRAGGEVGATASLASCHDGAHDGAWALPTRPAPAARTCPSRFGKSHRLQSRRDPRRGSRARHGR